MLVSIVVKHICNGNESWEASSPSMCLHHIIAHETYHFFHTLPLKLAPTCFIKQCGTFRTQEFEHTWWSGFQIMLNVQHKVHVTCKITLKMYKLNCFFFVQNVVRRFATHIFDIFNKNWRQVKTKRRQEDEKTLIFSKMPFLAYIKQI